MNETGTRWYSKTIRVDIDTGEQLTEHESKKYLLIKTSKNVWKNRKGTIGNIEYTKQFRRRPQLEIWGEPRY